MKRFRLKYGLSQPAAAEWMYLPLGTYRDYEQGRTVPVRIAQFGIQARIEDYARIRKPVAYPESA